ncbi:uncharacterized protein LOC123225758 [Mangifera indica]|uniref:uncharacterized protein LOC123225758 n=1 Tax=Mangifera indica TaxID=29780 RepID=UPI001CFB8DC0|nr:uncharacterized protein LOC123225758 [Mangifera indica]
MEINPNHIVMEQSRIPQPYQYNSMQPGNGEFQVHPASQAYMLDPTGSINANMVPPDPYMSEVKPVRNFSIQTGEEFALEFMRDRVNPRKPLIPNIAGDPNYATGYMELKGILGISHTGSESGSDVSMLTIVERGQKEFERRNSSLHDERSNYGSVRSIPPSGYDNNRSLSRGHASSEAFDSSSIKIKILCSFGGKILPRPSDGKLRYVGGETRLICLRKDISWQRLKQRTLEVYSQVHVIKYQLPGEDLDALVSVSCDEDLKNMMEECDELGDREGSQKLRIFLFSMSDLVDAQFSLGSSDGDSEIQYVVAINGMELGSQKSLNLHGLRSTSANDLNELEGHNIEGRMSRAVTDTVGVSTSTLTGSIFPSLSIHSSKTVLPSSSNSYGTHPQFYQMIHERETEEYPLHHGHDPSRNIPVEKIPTAMPLHGFINENGGVSERQQHSVSQAQNPRMWAGQGKLICDGSIQLEDDKVMKHFPVEEAAVPIVVPEGSLPSKHEGRHQEPERVFPPVDAVNAVQVPKCSDDNLCSMASSTHGTAHGISESDQIDMSHLEPPAPPQRIYYSEMIPRQQAELLDRLSKSEDSLISHSRSDIVQQDPISESNEKLRNDPQTIEDGLAQLQQYKEFADALSQMNSELSEEMLGHHELKQAIPNLMENKGAQREDSFRKLLLIDEKEEAGSELPAVSQAASIMHCEGFASNPVDFNGGDKIGQESSANTIQRYSQHFSRPESSAKDVSQGISSVGVSAPERVDIRVDVYDRFPHDFLSDIYSKAKLSGGPSGITPQLKVGAGISVNMENHEPKCWSYFRNLAQGEFGLKNDSLMDQDHLSFLPVLRDAEEGDHVLYQFTPLTTEGVPMGHVDSQPNFGEDNQKGLPRTIGVDPTVSESMQFDAMMENLRAPESEYEEANAGNQNIGLPPLDSSLGDFDISTLQLIKNEDLEELKELGSGTFGTVYHGKWRGTDVAIKRIKKSCFTGGSSEQERLTVEFWREADILSKLHHPNVMAFYGVVQDGPGGTLATVTEYMVDGSLRHVLVRKDRFLDRRKRLIIAMDAAFGMEYLHSKNIVHFDLKCDNLLVNLKDPSRPICKVGDFGLSKIKRNTLVSGGVRGTLPWMAPELLSGSSSKVSGKVDVFSFGIVLWEILTGEEPYANMHYGAIIGRIVNNTLRPTIPSNCDPEWQELMEQCWAPNPAARPSFTEIASCLRVMYDAANQAKHHHKVSK